MRKKPQASKASEPPVTDEEMRQALPALLVLLYEHQLEIYREMKGLLPKMNGGNRTFEELAAGSPNQDSLVEMYLIPDREAVLRRQVDEHMREFSRRSLPTPTSLLDFNRELWPTHKSEATLKRECDLADMHERLVELLDENPKRSTKSLAKELGLSPTAVRKLRKPDKLKEIYEEMEDDLSFIHRRMDEH